MMYTEILDITMKSFISNLFSKNMLQLYEMDGGIHYLDHQRHICNLLEEIPGKSREEQLVNSVLASLYLCEIWKIHLHKAVYPSPWYLCIQIERSWWKSTQGKGVPPYVILATKEYAQKVRDYILFEETNDPTELFINEALKKFSYSKYQLKKDKKNIIWRIIPN